MLTTFNLRTHCSKMEFAVSNLRLPLHANIHDAQPMQAPEIFTRTLNLPNNVRPLSIDPHPTRMGTEIVPNRSQSVPKSGTQRQFDRDVTKLVNWNACSAMESQIWLWRELPDEWIATMRVCLRSD